MHELSLVEGVLQLIEEKEQSDQFSRVDKVWLEVGELSCVEPEAMAFCFSSVMAGTVAEGATLELVPVPGLAECPECGQTSQVRQLYDACPVCGNFGLNIVQGRDVRLRSLSVS